MALVWTVNRRLVGLAATVSVLLSVGAWILSRKIPLPPPPDISFISTYGVVDNRRVLLGFGLLVIAALAGPILARIFLCRSRWFAMAKSTAVEPKGFRFEKRHLLLVVLITVLAFLFLGSWVAHAPLNGHELVHLGYLNEVSHGRVLNVDTRVTYGPLLGYSIYGFMKATSFDLVGFRKYWNFVTFLTLSVLLLLLYGHLRHRFLILLFLAYALVHTTTRYHLPGPDGLPIGTWGWANLLRHGIFPIAILWLWTPLHQGTRWWPRVVLGALPLLAGAYYQELGTIGALTAAVLLIVASGGDWKILLKRDLPLVFGGALLAFLVISAPAIVKGELGTFFDATWRAPSLFLQGAGNLPYPSLLSGEVSRIEALPYFLVPGAILILLAVTAGLVLAGKNRVGIVFCLLCYATFSYLTVLIRGDASHLANIMIAPLLAFTLLADQVFNSIKPTPSKRAVLIAAVGFLVPLVLGKPGIGMPMKALAGRALHPTPEIKAGWEEMSLDRGKIITPKGAWYEALDFGESDPRAIKLIRGLCKNDEAVVFGPVASLYYYLADVPAGIPYTDFSSQAQTLKDREIVNTAFGESKPKFVFMVPAEVEAVKGRKIPGYRMLGYTAGLFVVQRDDLDPQVAYSTGLIDLSYQEAIERNR
ncbi:MAG: hypothetical protein HKN21_00550 [Candidatus Eisenbacteria bacterium]|uniref:Glycosyltransferase RgtA/B/C/D-like domain-containing protein n=1 Tax=Eiseniibacteriota bacterium TaxID=2212470 RepID=A0A7Y2E4V0_UNCEI|nr:hypothetical protein [Candidatus Eisenbacteria bacterium]